jgi:hypothetical protein
MAELDCCSTDMLTHGFLSVGIHKGIFVTREAVCSFECQGSISKSF